MLLLIEGICPDAISFTQPAQEPVGVERRDVGGATGGDDDGGGRLYAAVRRGYFGSWVFEFGHRRGALYRLLYRCEGRPLFRYVLRRVLWVLTPTKGGVKRSEIAVDSFVAKILADHIAGFSTMLQRCL